MQAAATQSTPSRKPAPARAPKALHVGVIRGGKFVDDRWFAQPGDVTIGEGEKATFRLALAGLPKQAQVLFKSRGGSATLLVGEGMRGKVTLRGEEKPLAPGEVQLDDSARGRVQLGDVTFVFNFAVPPPVPPKPQLPREARGSLWNVTDHTFAAVLLASLVLHAAVIGSVSRRELPPEDASIEEIPDRFARLLVPETPKEPEKKPEEEKPVDEPEQKADDKKEEAKKEAPPKDSAEHKAEVAKAVASKGLVKILGSMGGQGSALANVLAAGGGMSDDIGAALAGAGGVAIATDGGGPSRKGEGSAQAASIGGLATSGGGNVKLREKSDVAVRGSVSAEGEAEVDSPTVDKEALGRFIKLRLRSIQGCYEAQLKRNPALRGKIVLRFTIGTRGQVVEVAIDSDTMGNDDVASCVTRLVKTWRLPFTPESDTPVSFPFLFQPG